MDGHGRRVGLLAHPVYMRGVEVEHAACAVVQLPRRAGQRQALFDELAFDDRDGSLLGVVVVEPRVVPACPRDDPDVDVVVAPELHEVTIRAVRPRQGPPLLRIVRDSADQPPQLHPGEALARGRKLAGAHRALYLVNRFSKGPSEAVQ